jgi:RNA polymerase sigma factor (sigma-70 family)
MNHQKLTAENEKDIIKGCCEGNIIAQKILYKSMCSKMFGVCMRYTNDYHIAEDILQEGFIKVFKNIGKYRGEGSFEGWVRRIFVNTSIEHYRKKVNLYAVTEIENDNIKTYNGDVIDQLQEADLLKMIGELSIGYRTVFNMYVIEGYSHQEIAEMLGISEGTSKSQLSRARMLLQEKVEKIHKIAKTNDGA